MGVEPKEKRGSMSESQTKIDEYVIPLPELPVETEYETIARMEKEIAEKRAALKNRLLNEFRTLIIQLRHLGVTVNEVPLNDGLSPALTGFPKGDRRNRKCKACGQVGHGRNS